MSRCRDTNRPMIPSKSPKNLEHVIYEKKGHVAYVTINRPEVKNALHSYAYAELRACWRDIGLDPNIYCGIVTGAGAAFCAGRDVKFLAKYQDAGPAHAARGSEQSAVPLGRRRAAERRQSREAADRRDQRPRGRRRPLARAAVPAARHGRGRLDRRHPHQGRPARLGAQSLRPCCRARPPPTSRCATAG